MRRYYRKDIAMAPNVGTVGHKQTFSSNWATKAQKMNFNPEEFQLHEKEKNKHANFVNSVFTHSSNAAFGA